MVLRQLYTRASCERLSLASRLVDAEMVVVARLRRLEMVGDGWGRICALCDGLCALCSLVNDETRYKPTYMRFSGLELRGSWFGDYGNPWLFSSSVINAIYKFLNYESALL